MIEFSDLVARAEMKEPPKRTFRRLTVQDMRRMEIVLEGCTLPDGRTLRPWLREGVDHRIIRYLPAIKAWVMNEVAKELGRHNLPISKLCKRVGCSKATFDRNVTRAAGMIAGRLNRAGLDVW